jgi:hypothetical protein
MRPAFTLGAEASGRDRLSSRHGSCRESSMNTTNKKKARLLGRAHATLLDLRSLLFDLPRRVVGDVHRERAFRLTGRCRF